MKLLKSSFWLHSIFYTLLQRFSIFFFGAVSYMVLVRGLSKENFAVWALYLMIMTLFEMIKQGLLRNPTIKFLGLSEYADKKKEVQSAALVMNITFSILAMLIFSLGGGLIAHLLKSEELVPLLLWSLLFVVLLIPYNHYEVLLQAHYMFNRIFWAYFIRQGIFFTGTLAMFFFVPAWFTLLNLVLLQIVALMAGVIVLYRATSEYRIGGFHNDKAIIRHMFNFGKYIFGTNLFSSVARSFDHFVTANMLGSAEGKGYVSNYNTVARINNMIDVPSLAAADVLFPKNVQTLETDGLGKVKYYFERMMGTILALVVPLSLFIFIFPKFIIYVLAGTKYYDAIPILQLTILFSLVRPFSYQFGSTLDAIGKPQANFYVNLCLMVFNLGATYLGLHFFGGMGAAYATVIFSVVSYVVMVAMLKKHIHLEVKNIFHYMIQFYKDMLGFARKKLARTSGS